MSSIKQRFSCLTNIRRLINVVCMNTGSLALLYQVNPAGAFREVVAAFGAAPHGRGAAELLGCSYQTLMRLVHRDKAIAQAVLAIRREKRVRGFGPTQEAALERYT